MSLSTTNGPRRALTQRSIAALALGLLVAQGLLFVLYDVAATNYLVGLTPLVSLVWITVAVLVLATVRPPAAPFRRRLVALTVATIYLGLLGYFGGLWGPSVATGPFAVHSFLAAAPPGWGGVRIVTPLVLIKLVPYKALGYLSLAYLLYVTLLEAVGAPASGLLGLLSCVSCTGPVLAAVVGGLLSLFVPEAGVPWAPAVAAIPSSILGVNRAYVLSTLIYLGTVALLYWRPGFDAAAQRVQGLLP